MPAYAVLSILMFALTGGGNDLLDYASPDAYWQSRNVKVSITQLTAELAPAAAVDVARPVGDLANADPAVRTAASKAIQAAGPGALPQLRDAAEATDPEVAAEAASLIDKIEADHRAESVRRLMAIRTLGNLKNRDALPALEPLTKSKEAFIADYASAAIAKISGEKSTTRPDATTDARLKDVWRLPADISAIIQATAVGDSTLTLEKLGVQLSLSVDEQNQAMTQMTSAVIGVAEKLGNARLMSLTIGFSSDYDAQSKGYIAMTIRGKYDSRVAARLLREQNLPEQTVAGAEVFLPNRLAIILPTDDRAILLFANSNGKLPISDVVASLDSDPGPLAANAAIAGLVKSTDTTQSIWGVARMTDAYKQSGILSAFDTVRIVGHRHGDAIELTASAQGTDGAAVGAAILQAKDVISDAMNDVKPEVAQIPALRSVADVLESIVLNAEGTKANASAAIKGPLVIPLHTSQSVDIESEPAPAPNAQ